MIAIVRLINVVPVSVIVVCDVVYARENVNARHKCNAKWYDINIV